MGSCENIVSTKAVKKFGVKTETYPKPYKLALLNKGGEVTVSKHALVSFSIGSKYKDHVWCHVVTMNVCHLLLRRPLQYDRQVTHDDHADTYNFNFNNTKIVLLQSRDFGKPKPTGDNTNLLSLARFKEAIKDTGTFCILIGEEISEGVEIPEAVISLVKEFDDVFLGELPEGLPPLRDIQHQIDLEPGAMLPNRLHY